jgi:hypothetical protein
MSNPYIAVGPDPAHDPNTRYLTADQLGVGRLQPSESIEGEWVLSPAGPAFFNPVSFEAEDQLDAERQAIAWLNKHLRTERRDLFHEGED